MKSVVLKTTNVVKNYISGRANEQCQKTSQNEILHKSFVKFNKPSVKVTKRIKYGLYGGFVLWFLLVLWLDVRKPFLQFLDGDKKA